MPTDLVTLLGHIATAGGEMQAQEVRRLLAVLDGDPGDEHAVTAAQHLVEAFLHDPHLTRFD